MEVPEDVEVLPNNAHRIRSPNIHHKLEIFITVHRATSIKGNSKDSSEPACNQNMSKVTLPLPTVSSARTFAFNHKRGSPAPNNIPITIDRLEERKEKYRFSSIRHGDSAGGP